MLLINSYILRGASLGVTSVEIDLLNSNGTTATPGPPPTTGSGDNSWDWPDSLNINSAKSESYFLDEGGEGDASEAHAYIRALVHFQADELSIPYIYFYAREDWDPGGTPTAVSRTGNLYTDGTSLYIDDTLVTTFTYGVAFNINTLSRGGYIKLTIPEPDVNVEKTVTIEISSDIPTPEELADARTELKILQVAP